MTTETKEPYEANLDGSIWVAASEQSSPKVAGLALRLLCFDKHWKLLRQGVYWHPSDTPSAIPDSAFFD